MNIDTLNKISTKILNLFHVETSTNNLIKLDSAILTFIVVIILLAIFLVLRKVFFLFFKFNIVATNGLNGTVVPPGTTVVKYGDTQVYTITPVDGYRIASVNVDGVDQEVTNSYVFSDVKAHHTIDAKFSNEEVKSWVSR